MKNKIFILIAIVLLLVTLSLWLFLGIIKFNNPSKEQYPIRGVDVSAYQGRIDWKKLSEQDIQFAYIKATEGSGFVDEYFQENYKNAQETNLKIGAYHFFSYDSDGEAQANNFINNVEKIDNMLPPVIDVEFYGDYKKNNPDKEKTQEQLKILINKIKENYEVTPIIYATNKSYKLYIANNFEDCEIWIRDIIKSPNLPDNRKWTFWQYTNREILEGYEGKEKYIDMNVFNGTEEEFNNKFGTNIL